MGCTYHPEELQERKINALFISCLIVSTSLFLIIYTDYLDKKFKNARKLYDVESCTAADYTVQMPISEKFYNNFCESNQCKLMKDESASFASFFQVELIKKLENNLEAN
jgi:hypothetical protein